MGKGEEAVGEGSMKVLMENNRNSRVSLKINIASMRTLWIIVWLINQGLGNTRNGGKYPKSKRKRSKLSSSNPNQGDIEAAEAYELEVPIVEVIREDDGDVRASEGVEDLRRNI